MSYVDDQVRRQLGDCAEQTADLERDVAMLEEQTRILLKKTADLEGRVENARMLGSLQGMVTAAAIAARLDGDTMVAMEILGAAGVRKGADLEGAAEYDIARLIEARVNLPGLHAAWQKARRIERQHAEAMH